MSTTLEAVTLLERYGTPSRRASCPPASAALVYSGVPKAGAPERMSTLEVNPPYITGAPGDAICDKASMAIASACCCTSAPASVTGLMAPLRREGRHRHRLAGARPSPAAPRTSGYRAAAANWN